MYVLTFEPDTAQLARPRSHVVSTRRRRDVVSKHLTWHTYLSSFSFQFFQTEQYIKLKVPRVMHILHLCDHFALGY